MSDYVVKKKTQSTVQNNNIKKEKRVVEDRVQQRRDSVRKVAKTIWLIVTTGEFVIAMRFLLKLANANPGNPFARLVFSISNFLMQPFVGLVNNPTIDQVEVDVTALIAILVYTMLAHLLVEFIWVIFNRTHTKTTYYIERE